MMLGFSALRLEPGRDNLFSMRDDVAHAKLRNKMASGEVQSPDPPPNGDLTRRTSTPEKRTCQWSPLSMSIF
jgi:hypothetical protein